MVAAIEPCGAKAVRKSPNPNTDVSDNFIVTLLAQIGPFGEKSRIRSCRI